MLLSAVVIVKDEERNIRQCLESLAFCDEIVVVDSGSGDRTAAIARSMGAKVHVRPFDDYATQKNFGISQALGAWIFSVDADERVSPGLAAEIREILKDSVLDGYTVRRENRLFGRWMRHGANAGDRPLRLARRKIAVFEGLVHERIALPAAAAGRLNGILRHESTGSMGEYMAKLNRYTTLEARALAGRGAAFEEKKAARRPLLVFLYRYFWQKGFLDGIEGFLFSVLSAYYEFVRRAKHWECTGKERIAS